MLRPQIFLVGVGALSSLMTLPAWGIVHWDGSTSDNWHTGSNWVGGQVPATSDDVYVTDPSNGTFAQLSQSDSVNFLFVDNGMQVSNAGNRFNIAPTAPLGFFPGVVVGDSGSSLIVTEGPDPGLDLVTSRFEVTGGGTLSMFGGTAHLTRQDNLVQTGGQISGFGTVNFGHASSSATVLENDGTIRPRLGGLSLRQSSVTFIDLDGPSNDGNVDVDDGTGLFSTAVSLQVEGTVRPFHGNIDIGTNDSLGFERSLTIGSGAGGGQLAFHGRTGVAQLNAGSFVSLTHPDTAVDVVSGAAQLNGNFFFGDGDLTLADTTTLHARGSIGQWASAAHVGAGATLSMDYSDGRVFSLATFDGPGQVVNETRLTLDNRSSILTGSVVNEGTLRIGDGRAHVQIGPYTNSPSSFIEFEIFGPGMIDNDFLLIQGGDSSSLAGELDVSFVNFIPSLNDRFTLIEASGGINGEFDSTVLPAAPAGARWKVQYSPTTVTLALLSDGDFDSNGAWECADVDGLVAEIVSGNHNSNFDLTGDGLVNGDDVDEWLIIAGDENLPSGNAYLIGDANLDGSVDGQDFVIWNTHKFMSVAAWCSGDFDANGVVNGQDFVLWNTNKFMSADGVTLVPEPSLPGVYALWPIVLGWRTMRGRFAR